MDCKNAFSVDFLSRVFEMRSGRIERLPPTQSTRWGERVDAAQRASPKVRACPQARDRPGTFVDKPTDVLESQKSIIDNIKNF